MEIKKVGLIGAGAVGAYFIYCLSERLGDNFVVIASGSRKERLKRDGILINDKTCKFNVQDPSEIAVSGAPVDVLVIATKYDGLRGSLADIDKAIGPDTIVLSVLNGIDSEEIVAEEIGAERILYSFMKIIAHRGDKGIHFDPDRTPGVFFGEKDGSITDRASSLAAFFEANGVHHVLSENIFSDQWNKYAINVSNNLIQSVFGVGYGAYFTSEHVGWLREKITEEVTAVANAYGIEIKGLPSGPMVAAPSARFSTLQDLDAGRHTEVDMFLGILIKKAKELGIPVPYSEYTFHAIKALEEKGDGIIS